MFRKNYSILFKYIRLTVCDLRYIRLIVIEALRLYPQPPLLIRRALKPDILPGIASHHLCEEKKEKKQSHEFLLG